MIGNVLGVSQAIVRYIVLNSGHFQDYYLIFVKILMKFVKNSVMSKLICLGMSIRKASRRTGQKAGARAINITACKKFQWLTSSRQSSRKVLKLLYFMVKSIHLMQSMVVVENGTVMCCHRSGLRMLGSKLNQCEIEKRFNFKCL